ncbi:hypothetical protein GCM10010411_15590 [Actinomadura fulvescens]|uniref:Uncharacterized protein n=1 Tax=Actinomadura fulvescens TaxID=46160 RepID=A0ABN3PIN9_9ACTN
MITIPHHHTVLHHHPRRPCTTTRAAPMAPTTTRAAPMAPTTTRAVVVWGIAGGDGLYGGAFRARFELVRGLEGGVCGGRWR